MSGLYLEKKETAHVHGTITARKGVFGICFILGPMSIALYTERENVECLERMLLTKTRPNIQYHVMIKKGVSVYMHSKHSKLVTAPEASRKQLASFHNDEVIRHTHTIDKNIE